MPRCGSSRGVRPRSWSGPARRPSCSSRRRACRPCHRRGSSPAMRPIESPRSAIARQPVACTSGVSRRAADGRGAVCRVRRVARARHDHRSAVRVGREQLVGARRIAEWASARNRNSSSSMLLPTFHAWTFCQPAESRASRLRLRARHEEREPEAVPFLVEPGVDALRVCVHDHTSLRRHRREVALGRLPPAERPDEAIGVELALAEHLGEPSGRDVPPDLHLPHPFLGVDEPWAMNRSCTVSARMWAMPATSRTTVTVRSRPGTVSVPLVCGSARPVTQAMAPIANADHDEDDDEHHRQHPLEPHAPSCRDPPDRGDPTRSKGLSAAVRRRGRAPSPGARSHPRRRHRRVPRRGASRRCARRPAVACPPRIASPSVACGSG